MISGLDREIVYARDWAMSVFLVLDGFSLVPLERGSPLSLIWVFPWLKQP
jgi:hypothetical protein